MVLRPTALTCALCLAPVVASGGNAIFGIEPAASGSVGSAGGGTSSLAVDEAHLYWISESGVVSRTRKTGGPIELVVAAPDPPLETAPRGLAVDSGAVHWTSPHPTMALKGKLWKATKGP